MTRIRKRFFRPEKEIYVRLLEMDTYLFSVSIKNKVKMRGNETGFWRGRREEGVIIY
jgi:mRNA-degrading endonuclease RelE of RelBE toxin-antitoxin system